MDFYLTSSDSDLNLIKSIWADVFGNNHPMVVNKKLMSWFYSSSHHQLPSGFIYSKNINSDLTAFIGYKSTNWNDIEEVWICGFGAIASSPGSGFFLLKNLLELNKDKNIGVVGYTSDLEKLYLSLGFKVEEGFRNLAKVNLIHNKQKLYKVYKAKEFFEIYGKHISKEFCNSYINLFTNHIVWEYSIFLKDSVAFFVRRETNSVCRVVMAYNLSNKNLSTLINEEVNELYLSISNHFDCIYVDFICNLKLNIGRNITTINSLSDNHIPGYFSPKAPYKSWKFAIKQNKSFRREIYFKADGDQERSNG